MTSSRVKVIVATVLTLLSALPLAAVELDVTGFTDVALIDVDGYTMERAEEHRVEATGDIAELKIIRLGSWLIIDASDASAVRIDIAMPDLFHLQLEKCGPGIVTGFRANTGRE